ncbi:MAG: hypothetical protein B0D92_07430 [Spirochaeta sp. LUC14_002_19_P3]|nr:MAG: hypothetical protein B0D92_07430 [Spirochaeta sp. LUC14_002_19_P3]
MHYLIKFTITVVIAAFTPGPNNSMLMQSGMIFGFRRSIQHILGVIIGFGFLFLCINFGIYALLIRYPLLHTIVKAVGTGYFAYLAYRMLVLKADKGEKGTGGGLSKNKKPLGFWGAFAFQWVNVKAWFFALSAIGILPPSRGAGQIVIPVLIVTVFTAGATCTWAYSGVLISKVFRNPIYLRIISSILAAFLIFIAVDTWL